VGIVIGLALGVLIGWSVGSRRSQRRPDELPAPLSRPEPAAPEPVSPRPGLVAAEALLEETELAAAASMSRVEPPPWRPEPEPHPDQSLMEALREANRRLNDEAQTRLSRESPDLPADAPERPAASVASQSSGQNLLELSRRLTEDTTKRLVREGEPDSP
jgi:hypothetical protein